MSDRRVELRQRIVSRGSVWEMKCDICGKHLGYVSPFDMDENYLMCDDCVPSEVDRK